MKKYLLGFALVLALIACGQKGAEPKHNDQDVEESNKARKDDSKKESPLVTEDTVKLQWSYLITMKFSSAKKKMKTINMN